jgi:hypothetical protein
MIVAVAARRAQGDWAGACAAAGVDVQLDLRRVARTRGAEFAALVRADVRHLVPDLLRWHWPRVAPDGRLRPGLTVGLAAYPWYDTHLVARSAPAWVPGQRLRLALRSAADGAPRPDRRFRLDLHRHLWDGRHLCELPARLATTWPAEAARLLAADAVAGTAVLVRAGRRRFVLDGPLLFPVDGRHHPACPVLPDAATWRLPDVQLLDAGLITRGELHPLLVPYLPGGPPAHSPESPYPHQGPPADAGTLDPGVIDCGGARHRIGFAGGVLTAFDHDPAEVRREQLLAALGGPLAPCLQAVADAAAAARDAGEHEVDTWLAHLRAEHMPLPLRAHRWRPYPTDPTTRRRRRR